MYSKNMMQLLMGLIGLSVLTSSQAVAQFDDSTQLRDLIETSKPRQYASFESLETPAPRRRVAEQASYHEELPVAGNYTTVLPVTLVSDLENEGGQYVPSDFDDDLASAGVYCETCGGGENCSDMWVIDARATLWARCIPRITTTATGDFRTVFNEQTQQNEVQFVGNAVDVARLTEFGVAPGFGLTVGRYLQNRHHYLELSYFGMNEWEERWQFNATKRLTDNLFPNVTYGNLFTPFTDSNVDEFFGGARSGIGGFDRADQHEFRYGSRIHNAEINLRLGPHSRPDRRCGPQGCQPGIYETLILGMRYFSLNERFTFIGRSRVEVDLGGGDIEELNSTGVYDISTNNNMFGPQIGLELMYGRCLWGWGAVAKVAPCINFAEQNSAVFSDAFIRGDPFTPEEMDEQRFGDRDAAALVGDVSVVGYYEIRPNLNLQASWDMVFVGAVAMAPEQLQWVRDPAPRVNTSYMHTQGISFNLTWTR